MLWKGKIASRFWWHSLEVLTEENFEAWESFFLLSKSCFKLLHIVLVTQSKHKDHLVPHSFNYFSYSSDCSTCKESNNFLLSLLQLWKCFLILGFTFIIFSFPFFFSKTAFDQDESCARDVTNHLATITSCRVTHFLTRYHLLWYWREKLRVELHSNVHS